MYGNSQIMFWKHFRVFGEVCCTWNRLPLKLIEECWLGMEWNFKPWHHMKFVVLSTKYFYLDCNSKDSKCTRYALRREKGINSSDSTCPGSIPWKLIFSCHTFWCYKSQNFCDIQNLRRCHELVCFGCYNQKKKLNKIQETPVKIDIPIFSLPWTPN